MLKLGTLLITVRFTVTSLVLMFIGFYVANVLISLGIDKYLSKYLSPLTKVANLPQQLSLAMPMALINVYAEQSYVTTLRSREGLSDEVLITYNLLRRPFTWLLHLYRWYLPIIIPTLGLSVGLIYVLTSLCSIILSVILALIYGRLKLPKVKGVNRGSNSLINVGSKGTPTNLSSRELLLNCLRRSFKLWYKVAIRYALISLVMGVAIVFNVFTYLTNAIKSLINFLNPKAVSIIAGSIPSVLVGIAVASQLLTQGLVSPRDALLALIIGRFIHTVALEYPKYLLPLYTSFYGTKFAIRFLTISILITLASLPIQVLLVILLTT